MIDLPVTEACGSLRRLQLRRRSTKRFASSALELGQVAEGLRAALGTTGAGRRTVPSARAAYPVEATLVVGAVTGLRPGAYLYHAADHVLRERSFGDHRPALAATTLDAGEWMPSCPALVILSADIAGAQRHFDDQPAEHTERFVWLEAGHVSQNVYLWAAENELGAVIVAGLDEAAAQRAVEPLVPERQRLLALLAIGRPGG